MKRGRRRLATLGLLGAAMLVSLGLGEIGARLSGYEPLWVQEPDIEIEPHGRLIRMDHKLGFVHLPGEFEVTFPNGNSWRATHGADTNRITHPPDVKIEGDEVWIFGCSFVHGWGLDDEETFPWKLQRRLKKHDLEVVNFGVGGYGTVQSLIQFFEALERRPPPRVVVLAYAGFHDERNVLLRSWRRASSAYEHLGPVFAPYAKMTWDGRMEFHLGGGYHGRALIERSAFFHMLDDAYVRLEDHWRGSHEMSRRLLARFVGLVRSAGSEFVVAGISREPRTEALLNFARENGVLVVDISVRLGREGYGIPFDGHPSPRATEVYAERLYQFLQEAELLEDDSSVADSDS